MKYLMIVILMLMMPCAYARDKNDYYQVPSFVAGPLEVSFTPDIDMCGNAGCNYNIEIKGTAGLKNFKAFFHPKAFKVFFDKDFRNIQLVSYQRMGNENNKFYGYLIFENINYEADNFIELSRTKIYPQDDHKIIYDLYFGS